MPALAEPGPEAAGDLLRRGRIARTFWLGVGLLLVGIAFIGVFVPLLPTVDFLLLALPCFARSSPRLEAWLLNHPRHGPSLRAWQREGAVPHHAKIAACVGMALGYLLFWLHVRPGWLLALGLAMVMLCCALWLVSRPAPKDKA